MSLPSTRKFDPKLFEQHRQATIDRPANIFDRDWGYETVFAMTGDYCGKVLEMKAGTQGGLQYHNDKRESFFLYRGQAIVRIDGGAGSIVECPMTAGDVCHVPRGAVHQVQAVTECIFFEVGDPVLDDRVNVEDKYPQ